MATEWDVTEDLPLDLTGIGESVSGQTYAPPSVRWDCSVGGLPFLFGLSDQYPMQRETSEFRRERIDNERDPGEQSLDSGYWIRSQSSWHYGSGLTSAEPLETNALEARFRFEASGGVDPWTPGKVQLLHDTEKIYSSTATNQYLIGVNTGVLHATGTALKYIDNAGTASTVSTAAVGEDIVSLTSNGYHYFLTDGDGIYKGVLPTGSASLIYDTKSTSSGGVLRWVKSRLIFCEQVPYPDSDYGSYVYEITNISPSSTTLPAPIFTHPNKEFVWTDIADGPGAIYVSGYSSDISQIYKFASGSEGSGSAALTGGSVVAEMPRGEIIVSMYSYLGAYLAIGTNKGLRIASIASDGSLSLGPLVHETTDGVYDMVAVGNYMWFTVGGKGSAGDSSSRPGLYRINLGQNLDEDPLNFAHAADLVVPDSTSTGQARQVTVSGGKVWFVVNGTNGGVFKELDTYVPTGWFTTGRIRLGTVEPKAWRDIRVITEATEVPECTSTITYKAIWNNVAELTTSTPHYLRAGQTVTVTNVDSTFNGTYEVTYVSSPTKFRYSKVAANVPVVVPPAVSFDTPVAVSSSPSAVPTVTFTPSMIAAAHASIDGNGLYSSWPEVIYATQDYPDRFGTLNQVTTDPKSNLYTAFRLDTYNANYTPSLIGYQVRAMPAPSRSRLIRVPVLIYDFELDRTGLRYGAKGGAWLRLSKLEELEKNAATVTYFDYTTGERSEAYIERVSYTRTTPPTRSQSGNGGIAQITLRLL